MKSVEDMEYHHTMEKVVDVICEKTQNPSRLFFRVQVSFYFAMIASMMRTKIATLDRGDIPVNMYALNLGTSGSGKGHSTNIIEQQVINRFRDRYLEHTFPVHAETNLAKIAVRRASKRGISPDDELVRVQKEFNSKGTLVFSFDSGTSPAVKQLREMLLMADAGSMNFQMDEIGTNLLANTEVLGTFLELYDVGAIKPKLIKNTSENERGQELSGLTPTNMLLFGTPSKLLDGAKVEEEFYSMLDTGYARRCFFGWSKPSSERPKLTKEEVFAMMTNKTSNLFLQTLSERLEDLADPLNLHQKLSISMDTTLLLIEYKMACEEIANQMGEHETMKAAELSHRYFKALKLAGAYAFIDGSKELTQEHLYSAIKLTEESGEAFNAILTRDRAWVKLAKYIAAVKKDVTHADLAADLPFYKGASGARTDMLNMAIAWGYKNNIIIKKSFSDGIEFLRGESLEPTDLNKLIVSHSNDIAQGYKNELAPWDKLHVLTSLRAHHWINHHVKDGHRQEDNAIPGFNLIVLDVEKSVSISMAKTLLEKYKFMLYTTKRHRTEGHGDRFRIIIPINYVLKLDGPDYNEFMKNVFTWLPFEVDDQTGQRARKWLSCAYNEDGEVSTFEYHDGELFDALPFIPKTSKNEERKKVLETQQQLDNLERWVMNNIGDGNRNNMLLRYAMILVDAGFDMSRVQEKVLALNGKLMDKLDDAEIYGTIMKTVMSALTKRS